MKTRAQAGVLVVGAGSIGQRHLRNLSRLGKTPLWVFDPDSKKAEQAKEQSTALPVSSLREGLKQNPLAVLICTPPSFHIETALEAVKANCHLFVEKPLSHNLEQVDLLLSEISRRELVGAVGFNLRFHPGLKECKKMLDGGRIGKLLSARLQCGQYLPDWHPWEDYRKGYSANQKLGGGILLDTHEFDYLTWLAGDPKEISCFADQVGTLETDTEDVAEINFRLENSVIANLHVDYLQRSYQRRYEFHGSEGSLVWDFSEGLKLFEAQKKRWETVWQNPSFDINQTYLDEITEFFSAIEENTTPSVSIARGKKILEWTFAAKQSSQTGQSVSVLNQEAHR